MNCLKKMTDKTEKCRDLFGKYKCSCPIELTARYNNHFGIKKNGKIGEIAGINMHGNFSITLFELLLFSTLTAFIISVSATVGKIAFKIKYKKRYQK